MSGLHGQLLRRYGIIRRAIERMNRETRAQQRAKRLAEASRKVRKESMRVSLRRGCGGQTSDESERPPTRN